MSSGWYDPRRVTRSNRLTPSAGQGSPVFDRLDGCEYVFVWRTSEACPLRKTQGALIHSRR